MKHPFLQPVQGTVLLRTSGTPGTVLGTGGTKVNNRHDTEEPKSSMSAACIHHITWKSLHPCAFPTRQILRLCLYPFLLLVQPLTGSAHLSLNLSCSSRTAGLDDPLFQVLSPSHSLSLSTGLPLLVKVQVTNETLFSLCLKNSKYLEQKT